MKIETQKKLRWIPFVNLITLPCCLLFLMNHRSLLPVFRVWKSFFWMILVLIPEILIDVYLNVDWLSFVVELLSRYFLLFIFSSLGISIQEDVLKKENHRNES